MKLKRLEIELQPSYLDNAGKYVAHIQYEDKSGSVAMVLDTGVSERLLEFIGPVLARFATQSALEIERNILASVEEARQLPEITV